MILIPVRIVLGLLGFVGDCLKDASESAQSKRRRTEEDRKREAVLVASRRKKAYADPASFRPPRNECHLLEKLGTRLELSWSFVCWKGVDAVVAVLEDETVYAYPVERIEEAVRVMNAYVVEPHVAERLAARREYQAMHEGWRRTSGTSPAPDVVFHPIGLVASRRNELGGFRCTSGRPPHPISWPVRRGSERFTEKHGLDWFFVDTPLGFLVVGYLFGKKVVSRKVADRAAAERLRDGYRKTEGWRTLHEYYVGPSDATRIPQENAAFANVATMAQRTSERTGSIR